MKARRIMMTAGSYRDPATRHAQAFVDDIHATGKLNEAFLPLKTLHFKVVKMLPMTVRMLVKGKLPPLQMQKVDQFDSLERIFQDFA